ncbi:MAG: RNA polymerase sigma factor WhiG [Spirochaetes bacterium GWB1_36_13]|nr:MAG: RNA polymerase sigma factor WhiG [Spirochaetes bacterium GWB1_36_13]
MKYKNEELINLSEEEELVLWQTYKNEKTPQPKREEIREKLILKYAPLVKYVAGKVAIGMPKKIEFDDLVGYGIFGLLDAIDKYKLDRNTKFKTYAITRIRGSIFDELRSIDWVPRTIRQKTKQLEKTIYDLEEKFDRTPTDEEIAQAMEITTKELEKLYLNASYTVVTSVNDSLFSEEQDDEKNSVVNVVEAPNSYNPDTISERLEIRNMIAGIIDELAEKEKQVLILYYYEDLTLKEIGSVLEVTESRVSQLHTKAILRLKSKLKKLEKKLRKITQ